MKRLATITAAVGLLGGVLALWGNYGWKTLKAYNEEHVGERTVDSILTAIDAVKGQVATVQAQQTMFEVAWNCDELYEELPDLRAKVDSLAPSGDERGSREWYREKQRLRDLEDWYDDNQCSGHVK